MSDLELFTNIGKHKWRIRLKSLTNILLNSVQLRTIISNEYNLKILGTFTSILSIPDDLLITAAKSGATSNIAFLDILDSSCFIRTICLCCYTVNSVIHVKEAIASLKLFCLYYDFNGYINSLAYVRTVGMLSRDLLQSEISEVKDYIISLNTTSDDIREINKSNVKICVAIPECMPNTLWVYSTPEGRRLLRHLARKSGGPVKVTVASSDSSIIPRFRYRMYAASRVCIDKDLPTLLNVTLMWVRSSQIKKNYPIDQKELTKKNCLTDQKELTKKNYF